MLCPIPYVYIPSLLLCAKIGLPASPFEYFHSDIFFPEISKSSLSALAYSLQNLSYSVLIPVMRFDDGVWRDRLNKTFYYPMDPSLQGPFADLTTYHTSSGYLGQVNAIPANNLIDTVFFTTPSIEVVDTRPENIFGGDRQAIYESNLAFMRAGTIQMRNPYSEFGMTEREYLSDDELHLAGGAEIEDDDTIPDVETPSGPIPSWYYWGEHIHLPAITNQKSCQSCTAHATGAAVAIMNSIKNGNSINMSIDRIKDCGGCGCHPCQVSKVLDYLKINGTGPWLYNHCETPPFYYTLTRRYNYDPKDWQSICAAIYSKGAGSFTITMSRTFSTYKGGLPIVNENCGKGRHYIAVVGYNIPERTYLIRNSWGTPWGGAGYANISFDDPCIAKDKFVFYDLTNNTGPSISTCPPFSFSLDNMGALVPYLPFIFAAFIILCNPGDRARRRN